MATKGATILLHGRNKEKGEAVLNELRKATDNQKHTYYNADFSSLRQVYHLADNILHNTPQLNMLINNAGISGGENRNEKEFGEDGYELRFTVNYLSHFLLTNALLPLLKKSAPSKIINIVSGAREAIDFNDVMISKNYSGARAYRQSKMALAMFTFDLAKKLKDESIIVNCLHPASMMGAKLVRESGSKPKTFVKEGTDTVMYVATSSETENITGAYFDHQEQTTAEDQAYDENARNKLHNLSIELSEMAKPHQLPLYFNEGFESHAHT